MGNMCPENCALCMRDSVEEFDEEMVDTEDYESDEDQEDD